MQQDFQMGSWRDLFDKGDLMHIGEAMQRFPNAARLLSDCAFISHAGADEEVISSDLDPGLYTRHGPNGVFLHSSQSGGADGYRHIVLIALHCCRYGIVVVSKNSRTHPWVAAEVDWLLDHRRPIAIYALDDTSPSKVHPHLEVHAKQSLNVIKFDRTQISALLAWVDRVDPVCAAFNTEA